MQKMNTAWMSSPNNPNRNQSLRESPAANWQWGFFAAGNAFWFDAYLNLTFQNTAESTNGFGSCPLLKDILLSEYLNGGV